MKKDQLAQKFWLASFSLQFQCFIKSIVQIYMLEISFLESGLWHLAQVRNVSSWDQPKGNKWVFQRRLPWPHAHPHVGAWLSEPQGKAPTGLTSVCTSAQGIGWPCLPRGACTPQRPSTGAKTQDITLTVCWFQSLLLLLDDINPKWLLCLSNTQHLKPWACHGRARKIQSQWCECANISLYVPLYNSIQGKIWKVV